MVWYCWLLYTFEYCIAIGQWRPTFIGIKMQIIFVLISLVMNKFLKEFYGEVLIRYL